MIDAHDPKEMTEYRQTGWREKEKKRIRKEKRKKRKRKKERKQIGATTDVWRLKRSERQRVLCLKHYLQAPRQTEFAIDRLEEKGVRSYGCSCRRWQPAVVDLS